MNIDSKKNMNFEDQFAAFTGQSEFGREEVAEAAVVEPPPTALVAVPEPEVAPEDQPPVAVSRAPAEVVPSADELAPHVAAVVEDAQTESLLVDLEKATESLALFRQEIGRLVSLQRTTAAELNDARRQIAVLHTQSGDCADCRRLESELSHQRELVSTVRAKLGAVVENLDAR